MSGAFLMSADCVVGEIVCGRWCLFHIVLTDLKRVAVCFVVQQCRFSV